MKLKEILQKLLRLVSVLLKLIPVLIEVLEDFSDDGRLNKSNKRDDISPFIHDTDNPTKRV